MKVFLATLLLALAGVALAQVDMVDGLEVSGERWRADGTCGATDGLCSGTWTGSTSAGTPTNITATTPKSGQFIKVGAIVTASFSVSVDVTLTNTLTLWRFSMPINATFGSTEQAAGVCATHKEAVDAGSAWRIRADTTNANNVVIEGSPGSAAAEDVYCTVTYRIP